MANQEPMIKPKGKASHPMVFLLVDYDRRRRWITLTGFKKIIASWNILCQ